MTWQYDAMKARVHDMEEQYADAEEHMEEHHDEGEVNHTKHAGRGGWMERCANLCRAWTKCNWTLCTELVSKYMAMETFKKAVENHK